MTRVGVISYPGACDDRDAMRALELVGAEPVRLWHADRDIHDVDAVIVPGGFSYGDHLRPGALAALSPVMGAVREHAEAGRPVLGICNGFQVLTEARLLPGVLRTNAGLRFRCQDVALRVERSSPWLPGLAAGDMLTIPMKHHDGCYFADRATLDVLARRGQVLLRYEENPNGSVERIACVTNEQGNVCGLMPHPEHAVEELIGSTDGRILLTGLLELAGSPAAA
ncbi:MAG: phosphoribosylformylglycinamidine synthase subunit PurQ / glutaminase [Gaiellales bacterium]|jgi:phosphoribosylformylglycinamidine synthase|nr:phosphoribosylformylglycinamidine synthase subunit PurQ / glutaminase [Gaiellales bacterium]